MSNPTSLNLKLVCKGTPEQLDRLRVLQETGELNTILGLPIENLIQISPTAQQPLSISETSTSSDQKPDWVPRLSQWIQSRYETFEWDLSHVLLGNSISIVRGVESGNELQSWQASLKLGEKSPDDVNAAIARTKTLMLGDHPPNLCKLTLFVAIRNRKSHPEQREILVQVRSFEDESLPFGIQLMILDEVGNCVPTDNPNQPYLKATSDISSSIMQHQFYGSQGEFFSIALQFQDYEQVEQFVI